uniref:hypothetical protein n=1 Tax=Acinetobacter baumannii TaxID=470 RepID=UPI001C06FB05
GSNHWMKYNSTLTVHFHVSGYLYFLRVQDAGHTVTGKPVHLENKQVIREHEAAESVLDRSHVVPHMLTRFFPVGGQRRANVRSLT